MNRKTLSLLVLQVAQLPLVSLLPLLKKMMGVECVLVWVCGCEYLHVVCMYVWVSVLVLVHVPVFVPVPAPALLPLDQSAAAWYASLQA